MARKMVMNVSGMKKMRKYTKDKSIVGTPETTKERSKKWRDFYIETVNSVRIECDSCHKARDVTEYDEPFRAPKKWFCNMQTLEDGSRGSCDLPSTCSDEEGYNFYPGEVVWAKMSHYPWWPGIIEDDPDQEEYVLTNDANDELNYHITFFGEKVTRSWIEEKKIKDYYESKEEIRKIKPSKISVSTKRNLEAAIRTAEGAISMSLKERLLKISFCYLYEGNWPLADPMVVELESIKMKTPNSEKLNKNKKLKSKQTLSKGKKLSDVKTTAQPKKTLPRKKAQNDEDVSLPSRTPEENGKASSHLSDEGETKEKEIKKLKISRKRTNAKRNSNVKLENVPDDSNHEDTETEMMNQRNYRKQKPVNSVNEKPESISHGNHIETEDKVTEIKNKKIFRNQKTVNSTNEKPENISRDNDNESEESKQSVIQTKDKTPQEDHCNGQRKRKHVDEASSDDGHKKPKEGPVEEDCSDSSTSLPSHSSNNSELRQPISISYYREPENHLCKLFNLPPKDFLYNPVCGNIFTFISHSFEDSSSSEDIILPSHWAQSETNKILKDAGFLQDETTQQGNLSKKRQFMIRKVEDSSDDEVYIRVDPENVVHDEDDLLVKESSETEDQNYHQSNGNISSEIKKAKLKIKTHELGMECSSLEDDDTVMVNGESSTKFDS